ncbi:TetR/AcrR family transcriptional regulator [Phenylobacterium deserti]|uniref:TetR/AcrR family transcriptional regulator n=1 Tax=Phenylobacterium deserti TaxID=1914756 RepID=A0A328ADY8_9CAUL|nr:TetR/AcrR family transcriptional regulator [Phenylobacterium deserti]RAK50968.1 TetR/AcrR family transcriptional regulator [Phenylobacterium deserti]
MRRSARKAKGDGHLRRAEILHAAERIFIAEGYEGATIRRIADEVGVSSTALYMHFPDKHAILLEICNQALREMLEQNRELAAKPVEAVARLRLMLEAYMRWGFAHPNAYQLVYSAPRPLSAGAWPEDTVDLSTQCYESFAGVVREIAAAGRLRTGTADSAAQTFWMSCHGVVALLITRQGFPWADREALMCVTLDALMHGLLAD